MVETASHARQSAHRPLLFLTIVYLTNLSTGACVVIALAAGLFLVALTALLRHRQTTRT